MHSSYTELLATSPSSQARWFEDQQQQQLQQPELVQYDQPIFLNNNHYLDLDCQPIHHIQIIITRPEVTKCMNEINMAILIAIFFKLLNLDVPVIQLPECIHCFQKALLLIHINLRFLLGLLYLSFRSLLISHFSVDLLLLVLARNPWLRGKTTCLQCDLLSHLLTSPILLRLQSEHVGPKVGQCGDELYTKLIIHIECQGSGWAFW